MSARAKGGGWVISLKITEVRAAASGLNAERRRCNIPRSKLRTNVRRLRYVGAGK